MPEHPTIEERGAEQLDRLARDRVGRGHVVPFEQVSESIETMFEHGGLPRGDLTGWSSLDNLYTVAGRQWTLITGVPGMGKSELVDALAVNLAERSNWVFAMYSPENYPVSIHAVKLMEKRARKPFTPGLTPRMSADEMRLAKTWVGERFTWIESPVNTLDDIVRTGLRTPRESQKRLGIVVDPWNTLNHHDASVRLPGMSETEYISNVLSELTRLLRSEQGSGVHVWVIAHPAKLYRQADGKYPIPTGYDVAGSAHFFNKADNILCVHRDKTAETQDVEVFVQKVRFKHIGKFGKTTLKYNKIVGRYFDGFAGPTPRDITTGKPEMYMEPSVVPGGEAIENEVA